MECAGKGKDDILCLVRLAQTADVGPGGHGLRRLENVCSARRRRAAPAALPDARHNALDALTAAEAARVRGVLRRLHPARGVRLDSGVAPSAMASRAGGLRREYALARDLTQRGTVAGTVLARDANLLRLAHGTDRKSAGGERERRTDHRGARGKYTGRKQAQKNTPWEKGTTNHEARFQTIPPNSCRALLRVSGASPESSHRRAARPQGGPSRPS